MIKESGIEIGNSLEFDFPRLPPFYDVKQALLFKYSIAPFTSFVKKKAAKKGLGQKS